MTVLLISGSPAERSRSTGLLAHVGEQLNRHDIATSFLAVRDLPAEDLVYGRHNSESLRKAAEMIDGAWAVVIATPIYTAAAAGVLKAFLDLLPQNALADKVVLPIGVGGSNAHLLAVDYTLKPVLQILGAQHILNTVYAVDTHIDFTSDGRRLIDDDIALRLHNAVQALLHVHRAKRHAAPRTLRHGRPRIPEIGRAHV